MAIYITSKGRKVIAVACTGFGGIVLINLFVAYILPQRRPLLIINFGSQPRQDSVPTAKQPIPVVTNVRPADRATSAEVAAESFRARATQEAEKRKIPEPVPAIPTDSRGWFALKTLHNAHFRFQGQDVVGDNTYGEAGVARAIDTRGGLWLGAWIFPNRDGAFDARFAIRAGLNVGWQYGDRLAKGEGGYAVRVARTSSSQKDSRVELWDGEDCIQRKPLSFQCERSVHLTVGFAADGRVAGRIVDAKSRECEFTFDKHDVESRHPYVALSSISTGSNALVFRNVCLESMGPAEEIESRQDVKQKSIKFSKN